MAWSHVITVSVHWSDFVLGEPKFGFVDMDCNVWGLKGLFLETFLFKKDTIFSLQSVFADFYTLKFLSSLELALVTRGFL